MKKSSSLFFLALLPTMMLSESAPAKSKAKAKPPAIVRLNKQTMAEIAKSEDIRACYENSKAGREKEPGVIAIEIDVGMRGEMTNVTYQKNQSTLNPSSATA